MKPYNMYGSGAESNYLPGYITCNNYGQHFTPEDITVILKLDVWAKTMIVTDTIFRGEMANRFVKHEIWVRRGELERNLRMGQPKSPFR